MIACAQPRTTESGERTRAISRKNRARFGRLRQWLAIIALGYTVLTLVLRSLPLTNNISLLIAVSAPYAVLLAVVTFLGAMLERRAVLALVAVVVMVASLGVQLNWYYGSQVRPSDQGIEIRILSANLRKGGADVQQIVELARLSADVITLSELTPGWVRAFYDAGMRDVFPHSVLVPAPGAGGIGVWSRYPVETIAPLRGGSMVATRAAVPGVAGGLVIAAVHVTNPMTFYGKAFDEWRAGIATLEMRMEDLAVKAGASPVIVAGDFNSTPDMQQFRALLRLGYRDAASQAGSGWSPTFPSARRIPPVITIDHMLSRGAEARSVRTIWVRGTDHRALSATMVMSATG